MPSAESRSDVIAHERGTPARSRSRTRFAPMAGRLHIATDTVKSHVHTILEKLSLGGRVEVAARGRLPPPSSAK